MTQTNGVDLLRKQILDEGDELLQRMTPIRTSEEKTTPAQPDIEATLRGWLELRLASELSKEKFRDREQLITLAKTTAKFVGDQLRPLKDRIAKLENESAKQRVRIEELEAKGVNFCGSYQRGNQYRRNEWVGYDGSAWIALADVEPLELPGTSSKWQQIIRKGKDGRDGIDAIADPSAEERQRRQPTKHGSSGLR